MSSATVSTAGPELQRQVISVIETLIQDWDLDAPVTPDTRLVADLEFESIDIIQMVVAFEQHFGNRKLGFDALLMQNGRYVEDLSITQIADFLATRVG